MTLNAGSLGGFNFELPKIESNFEMPGFDPPRRIPLNNEDEKKINSIITVLSNSGINIDSLYSLFNDWQSSKTKSVKRFVLSLSFILSLTFVAGIPITDIDLFGLSVAEGYGNMFLSAVLAIHLMSFAYFVYLRRNDLKVNEAKLSSLKKGLESCLKMMEFVDEIVEREKLPSVKFLFNDFKSQMHSNDSDIEAYEGLKFYEDKLKKHHKSFEWIEWLEIGLICLLGILALISIVISF
jgi:hypothetical protein